MTKKQFIAEERTSNRILLPGDPGFEEVLAQAKQYDTKPTKKEKCPKIELESLERTAIHLDAPGNFDILAQIYYCGGIKTSGGGELIHANWWDETGSKTCVDAFNARKGNSAIRYGSIEEYQGTDSEIMPLLDYIKLQKIDVETLQKILTWFDEYEPKRDIRKYE